MTSGEFRAWMDGFLHDRDRLSKKDIELIRAKSQEVSDYRPYYPSPYYWYSTGKVSGSTTFSAPAVTTSTYAYPNVTSGPNTLTGRTDA